MPKGEHRKDVLCLQIRDFGQHAAACSVNESSFFGLQHSVHVLKLNGFRVRKLGGERGRGRGRERVEERGKTGAHAVSRIQMRRRTFNITASTALSNSLAASFDICMMASAPCTIASRRCKQMLLVSNGLLATALNK